MCPFDNSILLALEGIRTGSLTAFFSLITNIGGTKSLIVIISLLVVALFLLKYKKEAGILAGGMLLGVTVSQSLKHLIDRARPEVVPYLTEFSSPSFPSGHAMNNMLLATLLTYISWRILKNKRYSLVVGIFMYVWAFLVGFSRLYLGVHYPSDVFCGWLFGLLLGLAVVWGVGKFEKKLRVNEKENKNRSEKNEI